MSNYLTQHPLTAPLVLELNHPEQHMVGRQQTLTQLLNVAGVYVRNVYIAREAGAIAVQMATTNAVPFEELRDYCSDWLCYRFGGYSVKYIQTTDDAANSTEDRQYFTASIRMSALAIPVRK